MRIFEYVYIIGIFNFCIVFELIWFWNLWVHELNFETFRNNSISPFFTTTLFLLYLGLFLQFDNLIWYQLFIQIAWLRKFEILIDLLNFFGLNIILLLNLIIYIFTLCDAFVWFRIFIIYFLHFTVLPTCRAFKSILKLKFQKVYLFLYFIILIICFV